MFGHHKATKITILERLTSS